MEKKCVGQIQARARTRPAFKVWDYEKSHHIMKTLNIHIMKTHNIHHLMKSYWVNKCITGRPT